MKDSPKKLKKMKKKPKFFKKSVQTEVKAPAVGNIKSANINYFGLVYTSLKVIPIILFIIFLVLYYQNNRIDLYTRSLELRPAENTIVLSDYPYLTDFFPPNISAKSAIILEAGSNAVLYSKNPELRLSMASTAKIMTSLVGSEYYSPNSVLKIHTPQVEGSNLGFRKNEEYYYIDLLKAMFLPSSNEAAYAIAENYPGGIENFVKRMNEKALSLGLSNTHFKDPAGLDDDENYSNVYELARVSSQLSRHPELKKIVSMTTADIKDITGTHKMRFGNLNKLLGKDGVNGIKTGTTYGAGEVLVTSKNVGNHTFIIVVMKSTNRFDDTLQLLSLLSNKLEFITPEYLSTTIEVK